VLTDGGSVTRVQDTAVDTYGNAAHGIVVAGAGAGAPVSQLVATNGRIETRGDHAFGLQVDGDAKATLDGVVVVTSGAGAHGVQVLDGGQVELADVTTDTTGATISSVMGAGATGVQQVTAAHSNLTQNNGTFMQ